LNNPRRALVRRQLLSIHFLKQRFLFGRKIQALTCERGAHARTAAADFRKLGLGEAGSVGQWGLLQGSICIAQSVRAFDWVDSDATSGVYVRGFKSGLKIQVDMLI
jgi:hypothetical protein